MCAEAAAPSSEPSEASAAEQPAVSQRESAGEEPAKGKKKKASKAAAGADIDALLAEIDGPHPAAATEAPPIPPAQPQEPQAAAELAGKGKKKKKKGGAAAAHEEDIDALLAQLDGPKPAEAPAPEAAQAAGPAAAAPEPAEAEPLTRSQGDEAAAVPEPSKKDKEGKKGPAAAAPTDDDDIDALLAEIGDGTAFWACTSGCCPALACCQVELVWSHIWQAMGCITSVCNADGRHGHELHLGAAKMKAVYLYRAASIS